MYIRMTFRAVEVYEILEPLLKDYRKIRLRDMGTSQCRISRTKLIVITTGGYQLTFMDEFVDSLLTEERVCDIILPRLTKRDVLEDNGDIGPRKSRLLDAMEGKEDGGSHHSRSSSRSSQARSPSRARSQSQAHGEEGSVKSRSRSKTPSDAGSRYVSRSPSRSRRMYCHSCKKLVGWFSRYILPQTVRERSDAVDGTNAG